MQRTSLLLLFLVSVSFAPLYDFGTMQEGSGATAAPGDNVTFNLYFFVDEQYGDRITHVRVIPAEVPEGWSITLDPSIHPVRLNVSGIVTETEENLYVEPRPVLPTVPDNPEEGVHYLFSPSGLGYLQAKQVTVTVHVPEDAELGKTYNVMVDAYANWYGTSGNVALTQARGFRYDITVASREYTEEILPPEEPKNETTSPPMAEEPVPLASDTLLLGGMGLVILLLVGYILLNRQRPAPSSLPAPTTIRKARKKKSKKRPAKKPKKKRKKSQA